MINEAVKELSAAAAQGARQHARSAEAFSFICSFIRSDATASPSVRQSARRPCGCMHCEGGVGGGKGGCKMLGKGGKGGGAATTKTRQGREPLAEAFGLRGERGRGAAVDEYCSATSPRVLRGGVGGVASVTL